MSQPPRFQRHLYPIIVIAATLVVFGLLATADFTSWDDRGNIWMNPRLNPPTWRGVGHYWTAPEAGLYIPLTYTVWGVLGKVAYLDQPDPMGARMNPLVFHSANIVFHLISAVVVYTILVLLLRERRASCIGALLFALHPVQVEPVAWCAGMKDVLSGMLGLISIWQYIAYAHPVGEERSIAPDSKWTHYAIASACFILAILAKPSAMVVPAIALAIDLILLRRSARSLVPLIPWVMLSIACAILTKLNQPAIGVTPAPLWSRPLIALDSLAFYLCKLAWPIHLGIDYGRRPQFVISQGWIWFTWILPAVLGMVLLLGRKRWPHLIAAAVIFVLGVAPVLGLVTFLFQHYSTTADHYLYPAMLGVAFAFAWGAHRLSGTRWVHVFWVVIILLGARSLIQTGVWRSDARLFSHALELNPRSFVSANNLGCATADPYRAEQLFRRAIELEPNDVDPHDNLAGVLGSTGRVGEAVEQRTIALQLRLSRPESIRGDVVPSICKLAQDLIDLERFTEARQYLEEARRIRSDDPQVLELMRKLPSP